MIPKLTAAGKNLLLRALTGDELTFTKVQLGNGASQDPVSATALLNPLLTVAFSNYSINPDYISLTAPFTNSAIASGFHATEIGFFTQDPDDPTNEVLYALGNEKEAKADYIPANAERLLDMQLDVLIYIGDAENVTAAISSSLVYAAKQDLDAHKEDTSNPHSVTKDQIGLGNVPNVATNDQSPTFTEAVTFVNIESGESLRVLFGKIKAGLARLISHMGNRQNPHGCTAQQVGAAPTQHRHPASDIESGILSAVRGGTGLTSPVYGALLVNDASGSTAMRQITGVGALYAEVSGEPEYGVLPEALGGTGSTSAAAYADKLTQAGLLKAVSGTYIGSGTFGSGSKNTLSFDANPKALIVMPTLNTTDGQQSGFVVLHGVSSTRGGGIMDDVPGSASQLHYIWDDTEHTVSWYSPNSSAAQQNVSGRTYAYLALI